LKNKVVVGSFLILWAATLIGFNYTRSTDSWNDTVRWHRVLSRQSSVLAAPGLIPAKADRYFTDSSSFTFKLKDAGFWARMALDLSAPWLTICRDPFDKGHAQIILRDEIADAFEAPHDVLRGIAQLIANEVRKNEAVQGFKIIPLMVPTKVAGNRIMVSVHDVRRPDRQQLQLSESSIQTGAFANQAVVESELEKFGINVLSVLDQFGDYQKTHNVLYPRGESHWTGELVAALGESLIKQIAERDLRASGCLRKNVAPLEEVAASEWRGDLFEALGWESSFSSAPLFLTRVKNFAPLKKPTDFEKNCPLIALAGSSYSASEFSGVDLTASLQRFYMGKVENRSTSGKVPRAQLETDLLRSLHADAIVIWEFPYRYAKTF
jgi:hypothetical protein